MEKYDQEYFAKVRELLQIKAQELAENNNENLEDEIIEIEILDETLQFVVSLFIEDYEYEEETDSVNYTVQVFITKVPQFEDKEIRRSFMAEFYTEQIY